MIYFITALIALARVPIGSIYLARSRQFVYLYCFSVEQKLWDTGQKLKQQQTVLSINESRKGHFFKAIQRV